MLWFIALLELRIGRRLLRTWFVIALVFLHVGYHYWDLSSLHASASFISASTGLLSPKYMLGASFAVLILILQIGVVLLVFDIRTRDARARITEAFSARPFTNFELLGGRLVGVTLLMASVAAVLVVLLLLLSHVLHVFLAPIGERLDSYSVFSFVLLDLVPNLALWCAITMVFVLLVRSGLVAAALAVALAVTMFVFNTVISPDLLPALANVTSAVMLPTDLAPEFANGWVWSQRLLMIFATIGLLFVGSLLHPRQDDSSRTFRNALGVGCLLVAAGIQTALIINVLAARDDFKRIASLHESISIQPRADIESIKGTLIIDPGKRLDVEYRLKFVTPTDIGDELVFAFNPGFKIESLQIDNEAVAHNFSDGLIRIPFSANNPGKRHELALAASGYPNTSFGYLDTAISKYTGGGLQARSLAILGVRNAIFHDQYVALTPAVKWYPTAGPAFAEDDLESHPRDQFTVDLEVSVPDAWIVAGPGSREDLSDADRTRFRFAPQVSLPEVGLFASRFVRHATTIEDIEFELLLHPKHTRNISAFADAMPSVEQRVANIISWTRELGLYYPYGMFSLVEVPSLLRVYGGGWRMDTIHALPGVLLLRESGFPTARFDGRIESSEQEFRDRVPNVDFLTNILETYFQSDVSGGNPFITASRNLLSFQTSPTGTGATPLSYLVDSLVSRIVRPQIGFYSIYYGGDQSRILSLARHSQSIRVSLGEMSPFESARSIINIGRPHIWAKLSSTALNDLKYRDEPRESLEALMLKGETFAQMLIDKLGTEKIGQLLGELRKRYVDGSYTASEFRQTAEDLQLDIDAAIRDWLNERRLPGFRAYQLDMMRLPDDIEGNSVYQTTFYLSNEEPVDGFVRISYYEMNRDTVGDTIRVSIAKTDLPPVELDADTCVQIALQTDNPLFELQIQPYLSLNQTDIGFVLPQRDSWEPQASESLPFMTVVDWPPPEDQSITIDDLDSGFSVSSDVESITLKIRGANRQSVADYWRTLHYFSAFSQVEYDQGLPTRQSLSLLYESQFIRSTRYEAWGRYRHTTAIAPARAIGQMAHFRARLPQKGKWQLEYHYPVFDLVSRIGGLNISEGTLLVQGQPHENFLMKVTANNTTIPIEIDMSNLVQGWNEIGSYDLGSGVVELTLQPTGTADVYADAIRWTPMK